MSEASINQLSQRELQALRRLRIVKEALDELKRKGIYADIPICPVCKSWKLVELTSFFDLGYIGSFQPALYCTDCGWYGRININMTNKPEDDAILEDLRGAFTELMDPNEDPTPQEDTE
ncbi:MAG: hypothetical protein ACFFEF_02520 [Candidatus Thorarchaeota archaeon]